MKFESRKLYSHGQSKEIFLLQIPKLVCQDLGLTKDTLMDIYYEDKNIVIKKQEVEVSDTSIA